SNQFTIDGVRFSLNEITTETVTLEISNDIDTVVENIKGLVESYNDILDEINGLIHQKKDRDYRPLTKEQKDAMSEDEIEKWEEKAKAGLLSNDGILSGMLNEMRKALFDKVEGTSISVFDIGISTGAYYERGKLILDETKLRTALTNNFDEVVKLFTNKPEDSETNVIGDREKITQRYNESGLTQRIYDILQKNIRTTRDSSGRKGTLLEKAGIVGDASEFNNLIVKEINAKDSMIEKMLQLMYQKEEAYYRKFTAMEKMLSKMESQSAWFMQQLGM
ncbi:MAG TPA: flagellar filament capping protein FliD, partial [Clostridium sp.]|nr:flagellar filament capping protein FliD [Clostridium sp.]